MVTDPFASARGTRDTISPPGSERSPRIGHGNSLQYSFLGNPRDRGAWWASVHRAEKSWDTTEQWSIHTGGQEELCQPMAAEPNRKTNPFFPGKDSIITLPTSFQFSLVTQSCPTLCDPMKHIARRASLSITNSQSPPKPMSIVSVMPSNHLILCHPLLLLPSIFQHWGLFK